MTKILHCMAHVSMYRAGNAELEHIQVAAHHCLTEN